jgi:hypothetical protein
MENVPSVRKLAPRFRACLLLAIAFAEALSSQVSAQNRPTSSKGPAAAVTALKCKDLVPEDATKAILAAFDRYEVVGMPAAHGAKDLDDLILHLIRDPAFANKVDGHCR